MMRDEVLARLHGYRSHDAPTHGGSVLSYVYDPARDDIDSIAAAAAGEVRSINGLDPTTFPSVALMEADLVAFGREVFGNPDAVGSVTSGGTESIILAVLAAREAWLAGHPGDSRRPTLVMPVTAHAAFRKAGHLLGCEVIAVPVDPATGTLAAERMLAAVDDRTALVVVSAPAYPHGVIDPVEAVAAGASAKGVPCHVDACIGGFVLPWWPDELPGWTMALPGVSSLSADLHKYGYAPKGASLLLFADSAYDLGRWFSLTDWPGYPVVNPTLLGSRSATGLASAWAVVTLLGSAGYAELTQHLAETTGRVRAAVDEIEGLSVIGQPQGPLISVATDPDAPTPRRVDPHLWADAVAAQGFILQGQPGMAQSDGTWLPRTTHLTITPATAGVVDALTSTLQAGAEEVRGKPSAAPTGGIPDPTELAASARQGEALDLAAVLALIEQTPRALSAVLLTQFLASFVRPQSEHG